LKQFLILFKFLSSRQVGTHIGKQLVRMSNLGFDISKFHFVGHSLGAHLLGQVGRTVKSMSSRIILERITGLDPAGNV
jgi:hypothetical protein